MHTLGKYVGSHMNQKGDLVIEFAIDDEQLDKLEKLREEICVIDIKKFKSKRSLNANAYFWHLVGELSKKLRVDKDTVYLWQLSRWGMWQDVLIKKEAYPVFSRQFRMTQVLDEDEEYMTLRCYIGSSNYNTKEMSDLMEGTLIDCKEQGIETWTREEIDAVLAAWEGV